MKDSKRTTDALIKLYQDNDWLMNLNFRLMLRLAGLTALPRDVSLLDCGCGMGHFMALLMRNGFANVHGLDASEEMISRAAILTGRTTFCGDVLRLTEVLGGVSFDVITAMNLQHHIGMESEWNSFLAQCHTALNPGGILLLREPFPTPTFKLLQWMSTREFFSRFRILRGRLLSVAEEKELLEGFFRTWPRKYRDCLERNGFAVTRESTWLGHRIVACRRQ